MPSTQPDSPLTPPDSSLARIWADLHPAPTLPLDGPFVAGLGPLLDGLGRRAGGVLHGPRARRVIGAVGNRYSVRVDPTRVQSRGIIRTHTARWDDTEAVVLEPMAAMAARRLIGRTAGTLVGRWVPIPGLRWLAGKVVDRLAGVVADVSTTVINGSPSVLVGVRTTSGDGVRLEGPLALTSLLSRGLTEAVVGEAVRRGIPVEVAHD